MSGPVATSVDVVSDTFVALVAGIGGLAGLDVAYGTDRDPENERLEIGNVTPWTQEWAGATSAKRRNEIYTIEVWIVVARPGDAQQDATNRAIAIFSLVSDAVRSDPSLGLGDTFDSITVEFTPTAEEKDATPEGRASWLKAGLHVTVRI